MLSSSSSSTATTTTTSTIHCIPDQILTFDIESKNLRMSPPITGYRPAAASVTGKTIYDELHAFQEWIIDLDDCEAEIILGVSSILPFLRENVQNHLKDVVDKNGQITMSSILQRQNLQARRHHDRDDDNHNPDDDDDDEDTEVVVIKMDDNDNDDDNHQIKVSWRKRCDDDDDDNDKSCSVVDSSCFFSRGQIVSEDELEVLNLQNVDKVVLLKNSDGRNHDNFQIPSSSSFWSLSKNLKRLNLQRPFWEMN